MLFSVGGGVVCTTGIGVVILVGILRFCCCSLGYYSFLSVFFDVLVFGIRSMTTISLSINTYCHYRYYNCSCYYNYYHYTHYHCY